MDFPVFLNKWIIGFKPIKYTIFWYWFRLINHDGWRMDDHQRYWDFWLNLNKGYLDIEYKYEFEKFWGKNAKPEVTYISPEAYDKLVEMIERPSKPSQALIDLMNRPSPWNNE